jgi:protein-S-isoprenylcysteine O-methyltransferase Ste14
VGSGDKIALATLPVLVVGLVMQIANPALFAVGGPPAALMAVSIVVLVVGAVGWVWSAWLVLTRVPRGELITTGPFALVKHPLYTAVSLMVLPWAGFLLDTWLGALVGAAMYVAARVFAPAEETALSARFGPAWDEYREAVRISWL